MDGDRYLSDYPNFVGDLSGRFRATTRSARDREHARGFVERHQNQLVFGSDCVDRIGAGAGLQRWWMTIRLVRELSPSKAIERKLLYENARRILPSLILKA